MAGDADKACELLELMRSKHIKPGMVSFNLVIEACARVRLEMMRMVMTMKFSHLPTSFEI